MPRHFNAPFFKRSTLEVAKKVLGARITTFVGQKETSGMIVEVEAYRGDIDQASHSYRGETKRNSIMFQEGGYCYVYFIYGVHHCINIVTGKKGSGEAILIRALEPLAGIETMRKRRGPVPDRLLTNGPGKLCQALAIDARMSGEYFLRSELIELTPYHRFKDSQISCSPRIGISKSVDLEWRFFIKDNPWVSKAR